MKKCLVASALFAIASFASTSYADQFTGASVTEYYLYPTISTIYYQAGPTLVNPSGPTFGSLNQFGDGTVTFSNNQIVIDVTGVGATVPATFNGMEFQFTGMKPITNTYLDSTSSPYFNASTVTFNSNAVWLNWQNEAHPVVTSVVIDVNTSPITSPVPEPETYAMLLAGLGLIGFMVRRKKTA